MSLSPFAVKPSNLSLETNTSENKNCGPMWVKFTCVASEANPLVTAYQLYKNDTPFSTVNDGTLTVEVSDKGTHFYSCLALHDAGNVSSSSVSVTFNGEFGNCYKGECFCFNNKLSNEKVSLVDPSFLIR